MKINCLSCGHNVDLDDAYAENYEGAIKCYGCDATLEIKTEQGSLRGVHLCAPRERLRFAPDTRVGQVLGVRDPPNRAQRLAPTSP